MASGDENESLGYADMLRTAIYAARRDRIVNAYFLPKLVRFTDNHIL